MDLRKVMTALASNGAQVYVVGGYVRDLYFGVQSKDIDIEIHGMVPERVEEILSTFGTVDFIGKAFGVYRLHGLDVDFSLPRLEYSTGDGHREFAVTVDPFIGIEKALRRRDFTMNALAMDFRTGETIDPFGGLEDIENRVLRHVDPETFVEDPLRVLRGAQFAARLGLTATPELVSLSRRIHGDFFTLSQDRVREEWKKLLLKGREPSRGIQFLYDTCWLSHFPELWDLWGIPQDKNHHPEGNVDRHLLEVIDRAAQLRDEIPEEERLSFMLAALLHDVGKVSHTFYKTEEKELVQFREGEERMGKIVAYGHDLAGVPLAEKFLSRLGMKDEKVLLLVKGHMAPLTFKNSGDKAFRRLGKEGTPMWLVGMLSWADKGMRSGYWFKKIDELVLHGPRENCVSGVDLINEGFTPGKQFGEWIRQCEAIFIKTGETNPSILMRKAGITR